MPVSTIHVTTVADTVATASFPFQASEVGVYNYSGSDLVYARADGTDPTEAGDDSCVIVPGNRRVIPVDTTGPTTVKVISPGVVSVEIEASAV